MFCNGLKTDEGDIARLGPTTITGMTILKVLFVLDHDSGRYRWFGWAHQLPPYSWGRPYLRQTQEYEEVCLLSHGCTYFGWVWLDILYVYICPSLFFPFFFFFYAWDFVLHWWLTGGVAHVVATCLTPIGWEASFSVEIFSISRIFQGKGLLILTFPFCSFSLLLLSYFPSTCGLSNFLCCAFRPLSSQFPPNFKVCSLFKLYFLSDFLSFEFLFSLFLCIFLW